MNASNEFYCAVEANDLAIIQLTAQRTECTPIIGIKKEQNRQDFFCIETSIMNDEALKTKIKQNLVFQSSNRGKPRTFLLEQAALPVHVL
jgi:hypothetical protein